MNLGLLEDRHTVAKHFKASTARRNELHLLLWECAANFRRQTDGTRLVVSDRAVLDRDHCLIIRENVFRKASHVTARRPWQRAAGAR